MGENPRAAPCPGSSPGPWLTRNGASVGVVRSVLLAAALVGGCANSDTEHRATEATTPQAQVRDAPRERGVLQPLETIELPPPRRRGEMSLEETLATRTSVRSFTDRPLTLEELGQLLWAAQGINRDNGRRTTPSAGAKYPLEVYVLTPDRVAHYLPKGHRLEILAREDRRAQIQRAAVDQEFVGSGTALFVIAGEYQRTIAKYGEVRSPRYVHLEAGHAAHGILLQAVALGLGATAVGGARDEDFEKAIGIPWQEDALYLVVVGEPAPPAKKD